MPELTHIPNFYSCSEHMAAIGQPCAEQFEALKEADKAESLVILKNIQELEKKWFILF